MMDRSIKTLAAFAVFSICIFFSGIAVIAAGDPGTVNQSFAAEPVFGSRTIHFQPLVPYRQLVLQMAAPDGKVYSYTFAEGDSTVFTLPTWAPDGGYNFEMEIVPVTFASFPVDPATRGLEIPVHETRMTQSGTFWVDRGSIVIPGDQTEAVNLPDDVLHYDDVIITGSLCVGFDCANGEYFGYDTIKLKENNLRIFFEDTSTSTFPSNDWRIVCNDSGSGGANYFAIQDGDSSNYPFRIEAGAPSHSLYIEDHGRVGFGTSVPSVELHIVDGDSPTIRLNQDTSSGWAAQSWDMTGNETNFFIRDVTSGSLLCLRIQPGTPSNTLCLKSNGYVGIGTWSPESILELEDTGEDVQLLLDRTDGAEAQITAKSNVVNIGSRTNHQVRFFVNQTTRMTLLTDDSLSMASGAECTASGVWQDASSIDLKENISDLGNAEAIAAFERLRPVKYNYKADKSEDYVGFIAEEVPDLVATKNRKTMSPMDIVAVLTKVVQSQQATIDRLKEKIERLEEEIRK